MVLVGRERELDELAELLDRSLRGQGRIVAVRGPVGSGKTELLQTTAMLAKEAGAAALNADASRAERSLPFGVAAQLLTGTEADFGAGGPLARLLTDGAPGNWAATPGATDEPDVARVLHRLCRAVLEQTANRPMVMCVDDAQHVDLPSLRFLSYLARRMRSAPIMMVLAGAPQLSYRATQDELIRNPLCRTISLAPLSIASAGELLAFSGRRLPQRTLTQVYARTGGSPLLLAGLAEDLKAPGAPRTDAFAAAVLRCLHQLDSTVQCVARAVTVVGRGDPAALSALLDIEPGQAARALEILRGACLLDRDRFRHDTIRAVVADSAAAGELAGLHSSYADLLHHEHAPPVAVARHLIHAGEVTGDWVVPVLRQASDQALADGDMDLAGACLACAHAITDDARESSELTAMQSRVDWHAGPATVMRRLSGLSHAARARLLTDRLANLTAVNLIWYGRVREGYAVLTDLSTWSDVSPEVSRAMLASLICLVTVCPQYGSRVRSTIDRLYDRVGLRRPGRIEGSAQALAAMMSVSPSAQVVAAAERLLREARVSGEVLGPLSVAMVARMSADRMVGGDHWQDPLLPGADRPPAPAWQAISEAIHARGALRAGDLSAAVDGARRALSTMSPQGWGVCIGSVLATGIMAATAAGRYPAAAEFIAVHVPSLMFDTHFGLVYRYARSHYHLAKERFAAAESDCHACGDTMTAWGVDLSAAMPWRTLLAQIHLRKGNLKHSRYLAEEELRRLNGGHPHLRAVTLRVLAAATDADERRVSLLQEAVDLLLHNADRLELAHTYVDLSEALHSAGEAGRAGTMRRLARSIAQEMTAPAVTHRLGAGAEPGESTAGRAAEEPAGLTELSVAERRVAELAARGHTNREIAGKLFVTISTVEQHLTRIYRKLRVQRRTDLSLWASRDGQGRRPKTPAMGPASID